MIIAISSCRSFHGTVITVFHLLFIITMISHFLMIWIYFPPVVERDKKFSLPSILAVADVIGE